MVYDSVTNAFGEAIVRACGNRTSMLDGNNFLWKIVNEKWIGKRSVWTFDNRACWIEDTETKNIKSWWCGKDEDYNESFIAD